MKFNHNTNILVALILLLGVSTNTQAQKPKQFTSGEIYNALEKLNFLGSALYVAAHPDDENTRMIAYLSNDLKANTAYLSLTRGDGGQNLIGTELKELLGVLRTQELLAARRIDGGKQFFTRANDFGYSKNPGETLEIWNKDEVLADVVWAIRKFRPDVIINRFSNDTERRTHGHHTSSAKLSFEAFDLTGTQAYREQLEFVEPWSPRRLFFNTSWWFYGSREKFADADKSKMLSVDVGGYYPTLGMSNTEIASLSRSQHKCQGFGSTGTRGSRTEYVELLKGDMPPNKSGIFEGINTSWSRLDGGAPIGDMVARLITEFDHSKPHGSVEGLIEVKKAINGLPDSHWKQLKLEEVNQLIEACLGLYLEAKSNQSTAVVDQTIALDIEYINRTDINVSLQGVRILPEIFDTSLMVQMETNQAYLLTKDIHIPTSISHTAPYWLTEKGSLGMYKVDDRQIIGNPETQKELQVTFDLLINGEKFSYTKDIIYKFNDPEKGEVYQPFEITPEAFISIENPVYIFTSTEAKPIKVMVTSGVENITGHVDLNLPQGWSYNETDLSFSIEQKGDSREIIVDIIAPKGSSSITLNPLVHLDNGQIYTQSQIIVDYDHIPRQIVLMDAEAKLAKMDVQRRGERIAYIMGAGDKIPESLEEMGYKVEILDIDQFSKYKLDDYDAIVTGIRAYNTIDQLKFHHKSLLDYVEKGGTLITQYTTSRRVKVDQLGPYPFKISRDRVSDEFAEIRMINPAHPVLNYPNKITNDDFKDWIQERGLYFPNEWDERYETILSSNDKGETPKDGGLLIARYGKGYYIHTGYSWFRQLPAGVPGAYRIFANLVSIGKNE